MNIFQEPFCATGECGSAALSLLSAVSALARPKLACACAVPFERHLAQTGDAVFHCLGSTAFLLRLPGYYEIFYTASVMSPDSREVGALLTLEGEMIPASYSEDTLCHTHATGSLCGMAVLHLPAPGTIHLLNAADETIYSCAAICIKRL